MSLQVRIGLQQCQELIGRHARQFRAIQKRLLARFKDKTPSGLVHLDTLLDGTFMQVGIEMTLRVFIQVHVYYPIPLTSANGIN